MSYLREHRQNLRSKIINWLVKKYGYKSYLEIGVQYAYKNFDRIEIDYKVGVDPGVPNMTGVSVTDATFTMTSDEFFEQNTNQFDIIFCDGLHEASQTYIDIVNSLDVLNEGGVVVCHDMNPQTEIHQQVPRQSRVWNGDCWKAFIQLRMERDDLEMCVIDADFGLGIIRRGSQEKLKVDEPTYENLDKNRNEWLNLISVEEFKKSLEK